MGVPSSGLRTTSPADTIDTGRCRPARRLPCCDEHSREKSASFSQPRSVCTFSCQESSVLAVRLVRVCARIISSSTAAGIRTTSFVSIPTSRFWRSAAVPPAVARKRDYGFGSMGRTPSGICLRLTCHQRRSSKQSDGSKLTKLCRDIDACVRRSVLTAASFSGVGNGSRKQTRIVRTGAARPPANQPAQLASNRATRRSNWLCTISTQLRVPPSSALPRSGRWSGAGENAHQTRAEWGRM